jgi:adenylosuccinate synthase
MRESAFIVVGLNYGDEGKGRCTDYLCSKAVSPLVIRFNGGHQAGHTVVTRKGERHMFSNFGAGSFRNVPTYWSRYCSFSPAYLLYELEDLSVQPRLLLDLLCPVSTHYDVLFNRALESSRGRQRVGTCGVGFGATVDRHCFDGVRFHVSDLFNPGAVVRKLTDIRNYYQYKLERETGFSFNQFNHDTEDVIFQRNVERIHELSKKGIIAFTTEEKLFSTKEWQTYIFEGAQGILLDQNFGSRPYITKSNTSSQNAIALLRANFVNVDPEIFYVSRSYLTRHGGGPFRQFDDQYVLRNAMQETNAYNEHQGEFKKGYLDLDMMKFALTCDESFSNGCGKNLLLTCLDQLPDENIHYFDKGHLGCCHYNVFPQLLGKSLRKTYFSFDSCADGFVISQ